MKRISRSLLFGIWMLCVIGVVHCNVLSISAEEFVTEDGYEYSVLEDGTIEITGYTGTDTELVIPSKIDGKSVTSIGAYAFDDCEATSIVISEGIISIKNHAFYTCWELTNVEIPQSVKSIGENAFDWCESLVSITLPEGVTRIEDGTFNWCESLVSIDIPNSVESIGENAFNYCFRLGSVEIPSNVASIGDYAFYGCSELKNIDIPDSVTDIGKSAFEGCRNLCSVTISNNIAIISAGVFFGCERLTSIEIPNSVTHIEDYAFAWCESLKSINIPSNVCSIVGDAFEHCANLTSITVDANNKKYNSSKNCNAIIETETNELIVGCSSTKIIEGVVGIGDSAFAGCTNLERVDIPESVKRIGDRAFRDCTNLKSVVVPESVTNIGTYAFFCCTNLVDIQIPKGITSIGEGTFKFCENLKKIEIPNGVIGIGYAAFEGCSSLKTVNLSDGLKRIEVFAFTNCKSLTSIRLPDSVTNIGASAFNSCGLTSIIIPNNVIEIGNYVLDYCPDSLIVYADAGSVAAIYAEEAGYAVKPINEYTGNSEGESNNDTSEEYIKSQTGCYSAIYSYGNKSLDLVSQVHTISTTHKPFTLTCKVKNEDMVSKYALYSGTKKIYENETGVFTVDPVQFSVGSKITVRTYSDESYVKTSLLLDVIAGKTDSYEVNLGGDSLEFTLPDSVPLIGGDKVSFSLPELPVEAVLEEGKLKVGFNINKSELYSSNSYDGVTTDNKKKDIKKRIKEWKKELKKTGRINKNWKKYLKSSKLKADMPGISKKAEFVVFGYAEGTWSDSLDTISGELIIAITGSGVAQHQFVSVPITVNVTGTVKGQVSGKVTWDVEASDFEGELSADITISLKPYAGLGVGTYGSIGVYGKAALGADIGIIGENPGLNELYLQGEAGVKAYFAKKELFKKVLISLEDIKKGELAKYIEDDKLLLYSQEKTSVIGGKKTLSLTKINSDDIIIQQVAYEAANYQIPSVETYSQTTGSYLLIDQAYGGAQPSLATIDNQTVIVYVDQDGNRGEADQTATSYIIYDATTNTYSAPQIIDDDGTADSNPQLVTIGEELYVYYLDARKTFGDSDPEIEDYASAFGVTVAKYDSSTKTFTKLGETQGGNNYCYSPILAQQDNKLLLAWVENASNDILGETVDNSICYTTFSDGIWEDKVVLEENISAVTSMAVIAEEELEFAYTLRAPSDLTEDNVELHLNKKGTDTVIASGIIAGLKYNMLSNLSATSLICNVDGKISYYDVNKGEFIMLTEEILELGGDYQLVGDEVYFVKTEISDTGTTRNGYKLCWHDDTYSVVKVTEETNDTYVDCYATDGTRAVYMASTVTFTDEEETNIDLSHQVKMLTDIEKHEVSIDYVSLDYSSIVLGESYSVDITLTNQGTENISEVVVSLLDASGNAVEEQVVAANLLVGETQTYMVDFNTPENLSDAEYTIAVCEQGQANQVSYLDETIDLTKTDLSVDSIYEVQENNRYILATVYNESNVDANGEVSVTDEDGNIIYNDTISVLASGAEKLQIELTNDIIPVDGTDVVITTTITTMQQEYDEDNNAVGVRVWNIEASDQVVESIEKEDTGISVYVNSITLNSNSMNLGVGDVKQLSAMVYPTNVTNRELTWNSTDEKVATVNENGEVTAIAEGIANIIVAAKDGSGVKAVCRITVIKKQESTQQPGAGNSDNDQPSTTEVLPAVGTKKSLSSGQYKVTRSNTTTKEVTFVKPKSSKKTSITIPATVTINGYTYKVTAIANKAFKNNKKLKSVTIGKNVTKIGKEAFSGCKKLKKITIKSAVLKSVGKNAIKGIDKKATIKVPKKQLSKYKKLFKSKTGYKKTMKIKK